MMQFSMLFGMQEFFRSSYSGVNHNIAGNGGEDCYNFISLQQRLLDTFVFTFIFGITLLPYIIRSLSCPKDFEIEKLCTKSVALSISGMRKVLLITLSFVFGIQVGFKILKCAWLFLLNPCHVITAVQIYLLGSEPSRTTVAIFRLPILGCYIMLVFCVIFNDDSVNLTLAIKIIMDMLNLRVHFHLLFGTFLALIFPVLNTFESFGEQLMYWLQHIMISIIVPPYLIFVGGAFNCEPLTDISWPFLGILVFFFYMMYFLQGIALVTFVNLNSVLCPAISDPFFGPSWRWFAMIHQPLLIISFGKIYTILIAYFLNFVNSFSGKKNAYSMLCFAKSSDKLK